VFQYEDPNVLTYTVEEEGGEETRTAVSAQSVGGLPVSGFLQTFAPNRFLFDEDDKEEEEEDESKGAAGKAVLIHHDQGSNSDDDSDSYTEDDENSEEENMHEVTSIFPRLHSHRHGLGPHLPLK
jgi:hypothetical protein